MVTADHLQAAIVKEAVSFELHSFLLAPIVVGNCRSDSGAPSVDGELCPINETGTIRRQEDNRLSDLVSRTRTTGGRLGS